jgi:hypothetical protein
MNAIRKRIVVRIRINLIQKLLGGCASNCLPGVSIPQTLPTTLLAVTAKPARTVYDDPFAERAASIDSKTSRREFLSAGLMLPIAGANSSLGLFRPFGDSASGPAGSPVKLNYKTLGRTGLKVTTVGFGCMITSDPSVIERAADIGINYFDTARGYQHGNNERMVGAALGARRKQVVIATKSGSRTKDALLSDLGTSLRELNTDYIDIWHLHGKTSPADIRDDMIEAQQLAKKQGKNRFAGVSTHAGQQQLLPWLAGKGVFDHARECNLT